MMSLSIRGYSRHPNSYVSVYMHIYQFLPVITHAYAHATLNAKQTHEQS